MMQPTKPAFSTASAPSRDSAEREATLTVKMPVNDSNGRRLGSVSAIHIDALNGRVTGISVRHGLFGYKHAKVPMAELLGISHGAVVVAHSKSAFGRLPFSDPPSGRILKSDLTWKK